MRLPVLALLAVLAGSFAFHAYRAEHPTSSYQSADERAYGRLAVGIADKQTYGNGLGDALHWPPGGPMLFAAGQALFPDAASAKTFDIPSAYWLQAIVSLGTRWRRSRSPRCSRGRGRGWPRRRSSASTRR